MNDKIKVSRMGEDGTFKIVMLEVPTMQPPCRIKMFWEKRGDVVINGLVTAIVTILVTGLVSWFF